MERDDLHDRAHQRRQLRMCAHSHSDARQRTLVWENGQRWQQCLNQLVAREHASDAAYQHQIDNARRGGDTQLQLEAEWFAALRDDIAWYTQFLAFLQHTHTTWHDVRGIDKHARQELVNRIGQLAWRMLERRIVYHQLALTMLERRRRRWGGVDRAHWREHWNELDSLLRQQDTAYGGVLPARIIESCLGWARRLSALQAATEQRWRRRPSVNWRRLRADRARLADSLSHACRGRKGAARGG